MNVVGWQGMLPRLISVMLLASAAYALVAVMTFTLFYAPFAGIGQLPAALVCSASVLLPYAVLYLAYRLAATPVALSSTLIAGIAAAAIGGFVYFGSFGYNDGEYVIAYVLTPILQSPFVLGVLGLVLWQRRKHHAA